MKARAKKAMVIGIDCMILPIVERLLKQGKLPNLKKLMKQGTTTSAWGEYPTATQPNWNVIQTGAYPGTSGVYDMTIHLPGEPLDVVHSAFDAKFNHAETLWQVMDKVGKKTFLFKYPGTWPPKLKNGYQVDGHGAPSGLIQFYWGSSKVAVHPNRVYTTDEYRAANKINFQPAKEWVKAPESKSPLLESEIAVAPGPGEVKYYLLLIDSEGKGYDRLFVSPSRDASKAIASLKVGQYSNFIFARFKIPGQPISGSFRMKLMELSPDAQHFKLFVSQVYPTEKFTYPKSLSQELVETCGPFLEYTGMQPLYLGWIDDQTFMETIEYHTQWVQKAVNYVLSKYKWDLFMMQWHPIDFSEHQFFQWDPACFAYEKEKADYNRGIIDHCYELMDGLVGSLMKYATADTLLAVISDHGITASFNEFMINNILINAGLAAVKQEKDEKGQERRIIDWPQTKAFAQYGWGVQIYVNLKGRDPQGIIEPGEEYEKVREEIIHVLHNIVDPQTGKHPVVLALRREDAKPLLHCGPNSGDVIYALKAGYEASAVLRSNLVEFEHPHYGGIHSSVLPNASYGTGTMEAMAILAGAGVKKNWRRPKPIRLVDFAPTVAYAVGVPAPAQSDGAVLLDLFE